MYKLFSPITVLRLEYLLSLYIYKCTYVYVCVNTYVDMYTHICVYMYPHIYTCNIAGRPS